MNVAPVLAVLVGGAIGTALRLGIDALLPHGDADFPVSTLLINVVGSFALGLLVARVWPTAPAWLRAGIGPGLLGTFTTFSAVVASLFLLAPVAPLVALLYLVLTLGGGIAAALLGLRLGARTAPPIGADE